MPTGEGCLLFDHCQLPDVVLILYAISRSMAGLWLTLVRVFMVQLSVNFLHLVHGMSYRSFFEVPTEMSRQVCMFPLWFKLTLSMPFVLLSISHFWARNLQTSEAVHPDMTGNSASLQII